MVLWSSKKQPTISRSSAEAEYKALAVTSAEMLWISYLLTELGVSLSSPSTLFCDNTSAGSLAVNPVFHARTKHIENDYHSICNLVESGFLQVSYVPSQHQVADIMTKGLGVAQFTQLASKLMSLQVHQFEVTI